MSRRNRGGPTYSTIISTDTTEDTVETTTDATNTAADPVSTTAVEQTPAITVVEILQAPPETILVAPIDETAIPVTIVPPTPEQRAAELLINRLNHHLGEYVRITPTQEPVVVSADTQRTMATHLSRATALLIQTPVLPEALEVFWRWLIEHRDGLMAPSHAMRGVTMLRPDESARVRLIYTTFMAKVTGDNHPFDWEKAITQEPELAHVKRWLNKKGTPRK